MIGSFAPLSYCISLFNEDEVQRLADSPVSSLLLPNCSPWFYLGLALHKLHIFQSDPLLFCTL